MKKERVGGKIVFSVPQEFCSPKESHPNNSTCDFWDENERLCKLRHGQQPNCGWPDNRIYFFDDEKGREKLVRHRLLHGSGRPH